mmetsp:Transcript_6250/g.9612  ORF Transcript_6250/g.9612 Transcript_6250/m.9612 type:complete len:322 (-) Transcript_6250:95-1060(-)
MRLKSNRRKYQIDLFHFRNIYLLLLLLGIGGTYLSSSVLLQPNSDELVLASSSTENATTVTDTIRKRSHHCINPDFVPKHKVGIWTMLSDNPDYIKGAAKMGKHINQHTKTPHDLIVMEIDGKPLGKESWNILGEVGFQRCIVKSIPPPKPEKTRRDLLEKFGVLHVWAMTVYDKILFIDADTYVQNSLDSLIHLDLQGKTIGVTKDIRGGKWVETFNSGVLLLHPSEEEFQRIHTLLYSGIEFEYIMSDQGFLNEIYKDDWMEIGFVNNANLALYQFQRKFWDEHKIEDINIIHYTMSKPWNCSPQGRYGPICELWLNAE